MFDERLKFPNSLLIIFSKPNVGVKPVKLSNIIPCCSASIDKFSGEIIGPKIFTEFNTNYCLKKTTIFKNIGSIINSTLENETLNLYHPLNWCSLENTDINNYTELDLKIKIEPIYSLNSQITDNKIQSIQSTILDAYDPSDNSSYYTDQKYELTDVFWCSLNSSRHSKLILASSENVQEILDNEIPNQSYLGVNNEQSIN